MTHNCREMPREDRRKGRSRAMSSPGSAERHEGEQKRGRGKQRPGKKSSVQGPSKHFSAPCSEFLLWPQSCFCILHRDLFFNETCLAEAVETASCLFHTPLETYNKLLLTEITRVHFYSSQFYVLTAVKERMLHVTYKRFRRWLE